ncbi:hypothetical protein GPECTOR_42g779 [Gonium pectorale]|uniref:Uncharacterized protein n=1 Tax=Gonium pectorale TaxID=33097 RepID=A0A150GB33_GONPE|nr:hypothetical protein GPECTOR_42g779 [Gonium pectorale]|eukprot:KXZ46570.1 hypothetical protein GPECTOR_42g779 [Gonium pectorale]
MAEADLPAIAAGLERLAFRTTAPASSLVLLGSSLPILQDTEESSLVAVTRYGRGRLIVFGGERMLTDCCRAPPSALPSSPPPPEAPFDRLIASSLRWAAKAVAGAGHGRNGRDFWRFAEQYEALTLSPPPSPPPVSPPPPPAPPLPLPPAPSNGTAALCLNATTPGLSITRLWPPLPLPVSRTACAAQIAAQIRAGNITAPPEAAPLFAALRGPLCHLVVGPLPNASYVPVGECGTLCPGSSAERCGSPPRNLTTAYPYP